MSKNINRFEIQRKEMSDFQKIFMAKGTNSAVFTQEEFDSALTVAKAEIMTVAIETTKKAILIEREECAKIVSSRADKEDEGELATALRDAAEAILNRIPSQKV